MCVPLYVSNIVNAFSSTYTQNIISYSMGVYLKKKKNH